MVTRDNDFVARFTPPHHGIIYLQCDSNVGNRQISQKLLAELPELLKRDLADTIATITVP